MAKLIFVGLLAACCFFILGSQAIKTRYSMQWFDYYIKTDRKYKGHIVFPSDDGSEDVKAIEPTDFLFYHHAYKDLYYQDSYAIINNLLESNDHEVNMRHVNQLKQNTTGRIRSALEQLSELATVQGCGFNSYLTNAINYMAVEPTEKYSKIQNLVSHYNLEFARKCPSILVETLKNDYKQLDLTTKKIIETFADAFIKKNIPKSSRSIQFSIDRLYFIENYENCSFMRGAEQITHDILKELAKDDEMSANLKPSYAKKGRNFSSIFKKKTFDQEEYLRLLEKYIEKPCKEFRNFLGPNIFVPAYFFAHILGEKEEFNLNTYGNEEQFYRIWANYRVCDCYFSRINTVLFQERVVDIASRQKV